MLDQLIAVISTTIVDTISALGYLGVLGLMALESACIPLPSEVIMPFAGYLASTGQFNLLGVATIGALACNLGSTIAYYVAIRAGGKPLTAGEPTFSFGQAISKPPKGSSRAMAQPPS